MDRMVMKLASRAGSSHHRPATTRSEKRHTYRLLHSTGELFIKDRGEAIDRLANLPGAKLFVLRAPGE